MSIPIPLSVRLSTAGGSRSVTRDLRDLTFRSVAPGGFASATVSLDRPLSLQPTEIGYYGKLYVYDARSGKTVWEGRVEDPGRGVSDQGQVWQIAAIGPSGHVHDRTVPLIYIDTSLSQFRRLNDSKAGMLTDSTTVPFREPEVGIIIRSPQGITTNLGDGAGMRYSEIWYAGQKIARCSYEVDAGGPNTDWTLKSRYANDGVTGDIGDSITMTTATGHPTEAAVVVTDFTNGRDILDFFLFQDTGGTVTSATDLHWVAFIAPRIRTMLYDKAGTELTTGYTNDYVLAHEIVGDLLGRLLTQFDGANAVLATNTYHIEQLAYPSAADPGKVLDDLMTFEPAYFWAAWESNTAGKYRFEWSQWPTSVRYEASTRDGYTSQGSADGLYNAVRVRYMDNLSTVRSVRRTSSVAELTAAGLTREAFIDLGTEAGTEAGATQAGDQYLTDHAAPHNAGTLTVARPILDRTLGRMVQPWEIRPGTLIRVRGITPRVGTLNATTRDGVTIFRVVGVTYRASAAAAELELDSYPPTVARALATLQGQTSPRR